MGRAQIYRGRLPRIADTFIGNRSLSQPLVAPARQSASFPSVDAYWTSCSASAQAFSPDEWEKWSPRCATLGNMIEPSGRGGLGRLVEMIDSKWAWEWRGRVPLRGRTSSGAGDARGASYLRDLVGSFPRL